MKALVYYQSVFGYRTGTRLFLHLKYKLGKPFSLPGSRSKIWLRPETSDIHVFDQVFCERQYDFDYGKDISIIVDAGANIGLCSIYMQRKYPDAKIISCEPDEDNFKMLLKNVSDFNTIKAEQIAIWNKECQLNIFDKHNLGKWAMVVEESESGSISATGIPQLMAKHNLQKIDILKVDVESSEYFIFDGTNLPWLTKVKWIVIELHDWMRPGCSKRFFETLRLSLNEYEMFVSGENVIIRNLNFIES